MSKVTPTQRSLAEMRERGYHCEVTEKWNPYARIRQDLFGFIDILCLGNGEVVGVQSTSYGNVSARLKKIAEHDNTAAVRKAGIRILVQGWDGKKLREVDVS
jgi:hypothetical protein